MRRTNARTRSASLAKRRAPAGATSSAPPPFDEAAVVWVAPRAAPWRPALRASSSTSSDARARERDREQSVGARIGLDVEREDGEARARGGRLDLGVVEDQNAAAADASPARGSPWMRSAPLI